MKTSTILVILILFNTSAIISEPVYQFTQNINPWLLIVVEIFLLLLFLFNYKIKQMGGLFEKGFNIDLSDKDVNVYQDENSYYNK